MALDPWQQAGGAVHKVEDGTDQEEEAGGVADPKEGRC